MRKKTPFYSILATVLGLTLMTTQATAQNILTSPRVQAAVKQAHAVFKSMDEDVIETFFEERAKDNLKVSLKTPDGNFTLSRRDIDDEALEAFAANLTGPLEFVNNHIGRAAKSAGGRFVVNSFRASTGDNVSVNLASGELETELDIQNFATRCAYQLRLVNRDEIEFIRLECSTESG